MLRGESTVSYGTESFCKDSKPRIDIASVVSKSLGEMGADIELWVEEKIDGYVECRFRAASVAERPAVVAHQLLPDPGLATRP